MYIVDLISVLVNTRGVTMNQYDTKLIVSFYDQISRGMGFTEKQQNLVIKILKRQESKLKTILSRDVSAFLDQPQFKFAKREIPSNKRMTIVPHEQYKKAVKVEFPYNDGLLAKIRAERNNLFLCQWNSDQKAWFFSLDERSLVFLSRLSKEENFVIDEELDDYRNQIIEIEKNIEKYVPLLAKDGETLKFVNASPKIPAPTTSDIIENMFLARKYGIFTWDESIEETDVWKNVDPITKKFLQADPKSEFSINFDENFSIFAIKDIVRYLSPVLFIVPGGSELDTLTKTLEVLNHIGLTKEQISVLFRLPNETGEKFNVFVKNQGINSPISEKTRAVFISSKIPKPVIQSNIKFNCIINFNFYGIHYTIRNLLKWHHNIVNLANSSHQRNLNFGDL